MTKKIFLANLYLNGVISILLFLLFVVNTPAFADKASITYNGFFENTEVIMLFDKSVISPGIINAYSPLNPNAYDPHLHVSYGLELCINGDPKYLPCGSRDIREANFIKNAGINISRSRDRLRYLKNLPGLEELKPLVDYFIKSLEFSIWLDEIKLEYLKSWDIEVLKADYEGIVTSEVAADALASIGEAETDHERYALVMRDWHNTVNRVFRDTEGEMPFEAWQAFLDRYKIQETLLNEYD